VTPQTLFFPVHRVDFEAPIAFGISQSPYKHHSTGIVSVCFNSFFRFQLIHLLHGPCCGILQRHGRTTKHTSHFTRLRTFARHAAKSRLTTHRDHHRYLTMEHTRGNESPMDWQYENISGRTDPNSPFNRSASAPSTVDNTPVKKGTPKISGYIPLTLTSNLSH
jgi:hypothetical protein